MSSCWEFLASSSKFFICSWEFLMLFLKIIVWIHVGQDQERLTNSQNSEELSRTNCAFIRIPHDFPPFMGFSWTFLQTSSGILRTTVILFLLLFCPEGKKNDARTKYEHFSNSHLCAPNCRDLLHKDFVYNLNLPVEVVTTTALTSVFTSLNMLQRELVCMCSWHYACVFKPSDWTIFHNFVSWMSEVAHSCRQQPGNRSDLPPRLCHSARGTTPSIRWRSIGVTLPCWQRSKLPIGFSVSSHIKIHQMQLRAKEQLQTGDTTPNYVLRCKGSNSREGAVQVQKRSWSLQALRRKDINPERVPTAAPICRS